MSYAALKAHLAFSAHMQKFACTLINDDPSVPWTMFNDDVQMGFFDVYDQYLLNILYDPRIRPGMTKEEVGKLLLDVLPAVREWIANTNAVR
jgi:Protein of unknown function (DUF2927)